MDEVLLDERGVFVSPTRVVIGGVTFTVNGITSVEMTRPFLVLGFIVIAASISCCGIPSLVSLPLALAAVADANSGEGVVSLLASAACYLGFTALLVAAGVMLTRYRAVVLSTSGLQRRVLVTWDAAHAERVRAAIDLAVTRRG